MTKSCGTVVTRQFFNAFAQFSQCIHPIILMLSPNYLNAFTQFLNAFARTFQCYYPIICPDLPFDMLCFALRYARVKSCYAIEFFTLHSSFFTYLLLVFHFLPLHSSHKTYVQKNLKYCMYWIFFIYLHQIRETYIVKSLTDKQIDKNHYPTLLTSLLWNNETILFLTSFCCQLHSYFINISLCRKHIRLKQA